MAVELAFETSAQSACQTILSGLTRSLVTFRSTARVDKVSHLANQPCDDGLVGNVPTKILRCACSWNNYFTYIVPYIEATNSSETTNSDGDAVKESLCRKRLKIVK